MNQKKSWAEKWAAQSDASRIANSVAFALAAAGLSYGFLKCLVPVFLWVHSVFGTKEKTFNITAQIAMVVLMLTQVCIAFRCSAIRKTMEQTGRDEENVDVGFNAFVAAMLTLFCLGLACAFMLMDVPAKLGELNYAPVLGLVVLNVFVFFVAVAVPTVLVSETMTFPEDPLAFFGLFTVGLSIAFLLPGFTTVTFALWVANAVLTFMLRPVSVSYEQLSSTLRYSPRSKEIAVNEGPFLGV